MNEDRILQRRDGPDHLSIHKLPQANPKDFSNHMLTCFSAKNTPYSPFVSLLSKLHCPQQPFPPLPLGVCASRSCHWLHLSKQPIGIFPRILRTVFWGGTCMGKSTDTVLGRHHACVFVLLGEVVCSVEVVCHAFLLLSNEPLLT